MTATVETTTINLETCDYWAKCACGYSMRIPSPSDSTDRLKIPIFCCGCGKLIVYTGQHRWLPHAFIRRSGPVFPARWRSEPAPHCALCGVDEAKHLPKNTGN